MASSVARGSLLGRLGWIAILFVAAAAAGAAAAATVVARPPDALRAAAPTTELPVGQDRFDDARSIQLSIRTSVPVPLLAPATGRVTSFPCEPGMSVESGTSPVSVDGKSYLALATREPLWRELTRDSKGDDVRALQEELKRLGAPIESDGMMGRNTMLAAAQAFARIGVTIASDTVPAASILWLPAPTVSVSRCDLPAGVPVDQGSTLATLAALSPTVVVSESPADLLPGPRVAVVAETRFAVGPDGVVHVPELSMLGEAGKADASDSEVRSIDARLVLSEPVEVSIVVPSAIFGVQGAEGCVASRGDPSRVKILGSQLGETIVVFPDGKIPQRVDTRPDSRRSCG